MSVDIEKLRALCAEVPESLTVDYNGDVVVGVGGVRAKRTGMRPAGDLFPLVLRGLRGDTTAQVVAELAAAARPAILALCDRVERAEVEVERLRTTRPASDMDIEKLRALCAEATPHPLTLEPGSHGRWRITVTVDGHTAEIAHGNDYHHEDGPLFAKAREIILAMCDRVERAEAEANRLRAENARLAGELAVVCGTARTVGGPGRCTVCGWPLAESRDKGCVDGDCWYRPWGGA